MSFTTTDSTSGWFGCVKHASLSLPCAWCTRDDLTLRIERQLNPAPAPESAGGEEPMSLIDERQVEVLDAFRAARDTAKRHAQSKVDRATMMKIQAEALIAEARELVAELNEDTPYPMEQGADIGPVKGAGGDRR